MNKQLRRDAETMIRRAIAEVKPDYAVEKALKGRTFLERNLAVGIHRLKSFQSISISTFIYRLLWK